MIYIALLNHLLINQNDMKFFFKNFNNIKSSYILYKYSYNFFNKQNLKLIFLDLSMFIFFLINSDSACCYTYIIIAYNISIISILLLLNNNIHIKNPLLFNIFILMSLFILYTSIFAFLFTILNKLKKLFNIIKMNNGGNNTGGSGNSGDPNGP